MITITPSAVTHLQELLQSQNAAPGVGLRLQIEKGGCAGMQYAMKLDEAHEGDERVSSGEVSVLIDAESAGFLRGCTLDYVESLNDSGFKIENPNAARSCGCGTSFEPKQEG
jgi:iron-sulfur cluster assembly protein